MKKIILGVAALLLSSSCAYYQPVNGMVVPDCGTAYINQPVYRTLWEPGHYRLDSCGYRMYVPGQFVQQQRYNLNRYYY